jgi:Ribbon-helix-helix protein, copG family
MIRTQIQLTEAQSRRLREEARRSGESVAELIRQSVDRYLEHGAASEATAVSRQSALDVAGRFRSGMSDVAVKHDDYLDESYLG